MINNIWYDGIMGLIVGDALGVPVEFSHRKDRKIDRVEGMRAYGTHNQPAGTWSDDSSMTLATVISIIEKGTLDYDDIMKRFTEWSMYGAYTPYGETFDIGVATSRAIIRYVNGAKAVEAGGETEWDNGNGSLMRILPVCLYVCKKHIFSPKEAISEIHKASALTHKHIRSLIGCGLYYFCVKKIIDAMIIEVIDYDKSKLIDLLQSGINEAYEFYKSESNFLEELNHYERLFDLYKFKDNNEDTIKSSGYVVDTLEAAIWCLVNTNSYRECLLEAVNLGDDTDTVGAVAGGLAGLYYGSGRIIAYKNEMGIQRVVDKSNGIPEEWISTIQKREWIEELCNQIHFTVMRNSRDYISTKTGEEE